jgi:hypothetical protein
VNAVALLRGVRPPPRIFVAATGAGAGVQRALWSVPGASDFLVGAAFPYAASETARFLGFSPARHCDPDAALELAMASYLRAREAGAAGEAIGLGLTASVATLEPHRGDHRIFAATFARGAAVVWSVVLSKGAGAEARDRDGALADELGASAVLDAAGVSAAAVAGAERREVPESEVRRLLFERPLFGAAGERRALDRDELRSAVLFPGSFAPFHAGHRAVAASVEAATRRRVVYAITADAVHKPRLRSAELLDRVASIRGQGDTARPILLTQNDPLFIDKARQFPGVAIAVGIDAVVRMLDRGWGPDVDAMLRELRTLGTRFFVMGRAIAGHWTTLADVPIPTGFEDLFVPIEGREDVSSTALRERS